MRRPPTWGRWDEEDGYMDKEIPKAKKERRGPDSAEPRPSRMAQSRGRKSGAPDVTGLTAATCSFCPT